MRLGRGSLPSRRNRSGRFIFKELFFTINKRVDVVGRQLEAMTVRDGVGRARFHAITAENAARIIDVIYARVALACRNSVRIHIFSGFDINAICWTGGRTEKAANTLFEAVFIAMKNVDPTVTRLKMYRFVWIVFRDCLTKHISEGYAEALHQRAKRLAHFPDDRCHAFSLAKGLGAGKSGPRCCVSMQLVPSGLE